MSSQLSLLEPVVSGQSPVASLRQQAPTNWGLVPAARLERPVALTVPCGIAEVDELTGGLPRGALTEICGSASSGRTSLLLAALAKATRRQEICVLVDATNSFDPYSAAAAGVELERLLWIRCGGTVASRQSSVVREECKRSSPGNRQLPTDNWFGRLEQALKVTDLLLQGGGFGLVAVDLADVPAEYARRVPLTSWFRFRRAVEHTRTVLLVVEQEPHAKSCASLVLKTSCQSPVVSCQLPTHAQLFQGIRARVDVVRAGVDVAKKPSRSTAFGTQLSAIS